MKVLGQDEAAPMSWATRDKNVLWHPFTSMKEWIEGEPLVIARAEGRYLFDVDGRRYFDAVSSLWVTVHGHSHPAIVRAIERQLAVLDHSTLLGLAHPSSIELAERLVALAPPGLTRVFYSDSGSTAVARANQASKLGGSTTPLRAARALAASFGP